MKMRVLVLGGSGFLGRQVVSTLAAGGWAQPIAASRRPAPQAGAEALTLDCLDEEALTAACAQADAVVNCVAGGPLTIANGARTLAAVLAHQRRAPRLVHLSSMAVYGDATGRVSEDAETNTGRSPYAMAKAQAEQDLRQYENAVILRPGCIYGRGSPQWSRRIAGWLRQGRIGDLGVAGDGCANLVHVDDVVSAIDHALRAPQIEDDVYNLTMNAPPTWNEYFVRYGRLIGAVPIRRIPGWRLRLDSLVCAAPLRLVQIAAGKAGLRLEHVPEPIPPSLLRLWRQDIHLDSRKATAQLQISWTTLEDGLRDDSA